MYECLTEEIDNTMSMKNLKMMIRKFSDLDLFTMLVVEDKDVREISVNDVNGDSKRVFYKIEVPYNLYPFVKDSSNLLEFFGNCAKVHLLEKH